MITDGSGTVVKQKQYEAFGNIVWEEGAFDDNREFTGKEKDPTGFHYFGARYYYGNIGRFLSPDPIAVYDLTNPQSFNPYVYCSNDPLNLYDPDGRNEAAIILMHLTIDYYYNQHLIEQYNSLYDKCPSCGPGSFARIIPDNPLGFKFGLPCFIHDNSQATIGISWVRSSCLLGMSLLDAVGKQSNNPFSNSLGLYLAYTYWNFASFLGSPSYIFAQKNPKWIIIKGKLKALEKEEEDGGSIWWRGPFNTDVNFTPVSGGEENSFRNMHFYHGFDGGGSNGDKKDENVPLPLVAW